jgi:hypothetical protein
LARRQALEISHSQFRTESNYLIGILEGRSAGETSVEDAHRAPVDERPTVSSASKPPPSKWKLDKVEAEKHRKRLLISRIETHEIEWLVDIKQKFGWGTEFLKVDGSVEKYSGMGWRTNWSFTLVDGGEAIPARISYKDPIWSFTVKGFELEIGGQILYRDG